MDKKDFIIVTEESKDFINLGRLVVCDKDGLMEIRDGLLKNSSSVGSHYWELSRVISSYFSLFDGRPSLSSGGGFVKVKDNAVLDFYDSHAKDYVVSYQEKLIKPKFLNSILIFSSLLGHMDGKLADDYAKLCIGFGIFKVDDIKKIWNECRERLLSKRYQTDLEIFQKALDLGFIDYDIVKILDRDSKKEKQQFMGSLSMQDLSNVSLDSKIIYSRKRI